MKAETQVEVVEELPVTNDETPVLESED